jgi:formylglycine-generating enzyme required for sulfatase activity
MAPEQFKGEGVDARSDQFSFCVALFEALSGERPFRGENVLSLSLHVTEGDVQTPAKLQNVPAWVRRPILRGLRRTPVDRHPSMDALIDVLAHDPAVRSRRRLLAIASVGAIVAGFFAVRHMVVGRQQAVDAKVSALVDEAATATREARDRGEAVRDLRTRAFAAFDGMDRVAGEPLWRQSLSALRDADRAYERAEQASDAALVLDPSRINLRGATANLLSEHLSLAEQARSTERAQSLAAALAARDVDGSVRRQRAMLASLTARVQPAGAVVVLERYDRDPVTRRRIPAPVSLSATATELPAGSYRLSARLDGFAGALFPFTIEPKERKTIELTLPPRADVPEGFIYVPAGEFLYGEADEQLRTQFLNTSPIHRRRTGAYLIAANETTYREWIDFLTTLPPADRARHSPSITTLRGALRLTQTSNRWQLSFQPTTRRYVAVLGESFSYVGRKERTRQDWSRFPVAGVSSEAIARYLRWLSSTRRVPGARLCNEIEWERAARGADERLYPHGDELSAEDANFDLTYDRTDGAYGPDEIGSHPASRSPFGVDDLAGNVYELVTSSMKPDELLIRGGAYYYGSISARVTNREPVPASFSDVTTGIRVCADAPARK